MGEDLLSITRQEGHLKLVGDRVFLRRWKMVHLADKLWKLPWPV